MISVYLLLDYYRLYFSCHTYYLSETINLLCYSKIHEILKTKANWKAL